MKYKCCIDKQIFSFRGMQILGLSRNMGVYFFITLKYFFEDIEALPEGILPILYLDRTMSGRIVVVVYKWFYLEYIWSR